MSSVRPDQVDDTSGLPHWSCCPPEPERLFSPQLDRKSTAPPDLVRSLSQSKIELHRPVNRSKTRAKFESSIISALQWWDATSLRTCLALLSISVGCFLTVFIPQLNLYLISFFLLQSLSNGSSMCKRDRRDCFPNILFRDCNSICSYAK